MGRDMASYTEGWTWVGPGPKRSRWGGLMEQAAEAAMGSVMVAMTRHFSSSRGALLPMNSA